MDAQLYAEDITWGQQNNSMNNSKVWIQFNSSRLIHEAATQTNSFNIYPNTTLTKIIRNTTNAGNSESAFESQIIIPLYVVIFLLSVIGNSLVLITLVQNKRMRTVTNVYLLNLALSDLLLGVFCMPFTLVGQVLKNFIFGAIMCKLIPYFQAVSVSVAIWTLVAISLERYFAICRSLKSRRWQTQFHAYKMIVVVWISSLLWSTPILVYSSLKTMKNRDGFKCREDWPTRRSEQVFNLYLDAMLLLVPLIFMSLAYSLIVSKLWKGLKREIQHNNSCQQQLSNSSSAVNDQIVRNNNTPALNGATLNSFRNQRYQPPDIRITSEIHKCEEQKPNKRADTVRRWFAKGINQFRRSNKSEGYCNYHKTKTASGTKKQTLTSTEPQTTETNKSGLCSEDMCSCVDENTYTFSRQAIRSNYMDKSIEAKKKVIRMLFVVVLEFFICWAPLHILNTWYLFYPEAVYKYVGSTGISLVQLLAYISSCCNPITYCFMNRKFRQAFLAIFHSQRLCCCYQKTEARFNTILQQRNGINKIIVNNSDVSLNDSILYLGRASTIGRSEVLVLEAEERV